MIKTRVTQSRVSDGHTETTARRNSMARGVFLLLAVLLCAAAATLDVEEKQKEEKERESARELVEDDTAEGTPDKPQNVQVFPQGSSSVMVLWDKPSSGADVDHYLVYVEDEDMEDTTVDYYYVWNGLKACTNYTFGVRAVAAAGNMSDPALADGVTDIGLPPEPQNLHVEDYTYATVTLAWEKPDTQCDIDFYRVKYNEEGSDLVTETTSVVSDLLPNTTYTFSVIATTSVGDGPAATVTQTTALEPGPPRDLIAEGISSSAIQVSWSAPNREPDNYLVSADPCMYSEVIVYELMYVIEDLEPCKRCFITVTSVYSDDGKFPATVQGETNGGAPPSPESCSVEVDKNFITVNWERPSTPCVLGPYNVTWTWQKLWGDGEEESDRKNTTGESLAVYNPLPYHNYTFEIAASVDGLFGSPTFCSGISLESPAGPPVLLSVESEEAGVAQVKWDSPAEENGEILEYGIFVNDAEDPTKNVSGEVHSTTVSLQECVVFNISVEALNDAGWGERSEAMDVMVVGDVLPAELQCPEPDPEVQVCWDPYSTSCPVSQYNLKWEGEVLWSNSTDSNSTTLEWSENETCYHIPSTPYTRYTVELSVGNKQDETKKCSVTTPMAAPGPPELEELQTNNLAINVTWKEPEEKNGIISEYEVKWTDWNGVEKSTSTNGKTFSVQIVESSCGGTVDVTVRAKTTAFGEESPLRTAFLVNSISDLKCEPTEPSMIVLSWDVEYSECPIKEYNVTWTFVSLWSEDKGSGSQSVDGSEVSAKLTSLPPYSSVSVEVHVDNAPADTNCNSTTPEQASSRPTDLHQISNDTNSVTVEWSLPKFVRGKLLGWHLNWTTLSDESLGEQDINDPQSMTFKITELSPSEKYLVYVMAVNGAGKGEAEGTKVQTGNNNNNNDQQNSDLGLILGVSIGGGVLLILLLVGGVIVYKKKNNRKPPRSASLTLGVISSDNGSLSKDQYLSAANQQFQGKSETIDWGTNSELYPGNGKARDNSEDMGIDDGDNFELIMMNGHNTAPAGKDNLFQAPGARRLSQQVSSSVPRQTEYNRRPSQQANLRMQGFEEYNRRSSQQDFSGTSDFNRRAPYREGVAKPNVGEFGRRPSQQIDLGRPSLKEFGRRPSQQINIPRPSSTEYSRRPSQQIDQARPRAVEYGRRPSQQIDPGRPNLREYERRPSQQIDVGRPRSGEYARRPSQQVDIGHSPQQPVPARPAYNHYMRRPSQQADIGMPGDRAFMRRPSQQFIMSFDGIQEQ